MALCGNEVTACAQDPACAAIVACEGTCAPFPACFQDCVAGVDIAARQLFAAAYDCTVCKSCIEDCTLTAVAPLCP
jgi:hypothetical protein